MSQRLLAEKLNISRTHLSFIENDKALPDKEMLKKMADILKVSPLDLYAVKTVRLIMERE